MLYFAYGMNTNPAYMHGCHLVGRARLHGFKFSFRGVANIERVASGTVEGALWQIDDSALASLDRREGYPNFYDRGTVTVEVLDENGEREFVKQAITYWMPKPNRIPIEEPSHHYENICRVGYGMVGIPDDQIDEALSVFPGEVAS